MVKRNRIYVPSSGPEAWQQFLAEPEKQWRTGYSAKTLAHCWESSAGLPPEVAALFPNGSELLLAFPEHKVPLPGGARDSQNDVFALIRHGNLTCAATIEGKVNEPFGPSVGDWMREASPGKVLRMNHLCELLGLAEQPHALIRYQLLHRTASAIIEARRFKTDEAAMIVHSFSPARMWFEDFAAFMSLFGCSVTSDQPVEVLLPEGMKLRLGWATGDASFLAI
ncbi:hypothetical protein ASE23_20230 [Rhizobium sp. Root73]|uniref:DUF6946 family protein n=1 Tax=unclassified Rhizobium TaxID=2613769 RepID=UPI00072B456F|nr:MULTISPECIES: hypothetical protein [unclassified Rhizobium]KQY16313.1 hypothetical protein ASD36_22905 [Rhizobium sp. Root1334]KRC12692.1 hypothetical protein ASE23_20230 [Rhizobium sp. Root73]